MIEWFTAKELAGLSNMPSTKSGVIRKAARGNWPSRSRKGKGGGVEYHISTLPFDTQSTLRASAVDQQLNDERGQSIADFCGSEDAKKQEYKNKKKKEAGIAKFAALPAERKSRARAKEYLVIEADHYLTNNGYKRLQGLQVFCADLKDGKITVPERYKRHLNQLHGHVHLHPSTLRDWERQYRESGIFALVDNYGSRKGKSKIEQNPDLKKIVLRCISELPHITGKKIKQYIQATEPHLDIVSAKSIERYVDNWKSENEQLWMSMTNPDAWKNSFQPAFGSHHRQIDRLNQLWELDSTPGDWMLTDGRHSVVGVIDMMSRRMKLLVSKTSKASAICRVFRRAVLDWGVPEGVRIDNGADYTSNQFLTVLDWLEIPPHVCTPFESQEKGTVERALQTMSHGILDLLPGFIGHNVAERKVIEARKSFASRIMKSDEVVEVALSSTELQEKLDQWTDHIYMHDAHAGLDGKSPWDVSTGWTGTINRITDERALDMLLAEVAGVRVVTKKGIALDRHHYISKELGPIVGTEVQLRRDEQDIGHIYVYALDGEFVCKAVCPEVLGISPVEIANAAKNLTKKVLGQQRKEIRKIKASFKDNIAEEIIKHRVEQSQNVTALPHKSQEYTTPGLRAAAEAADSKLDRQPEAAGLTEKEQAEHQKLIDVMSKPAEVVQIRDSAEQRYARAFALDQRQNLSTDDQQWLSSYQQTAEYKAQRMIHEDFGITPEWCGASQ